MDLNAVIQQASSVIVCAVALFKAVEKLYKILFKKE